jgi:uncharacterized protein YbjT (DUF2867 family)
MIAASRILIAGGSGLIGQAVLEQLLARPSIQIVALVRRPLGLVAPELTEIVCDFGSLEAHPLPDADVAICCLGTTLKVAGSREAFHRVDFDYIVNFARAAKKAGVKRFVLLSSAGASPSARVYYSRVKGETETAVKDVGFERLVIARPSLLLGDRGRLGQPTRPIESAAQGFLKPLVAIIPMAFRPIRAEVVARALVRLADEAGQGILIAESARLFQAGSEKPGS